MARVSIIMPVYNAEKELAGVLESVETQTMEDYELIIVDDGSDDGSREILEESSRSNEKIRIMRQENQGPAAARNRGLKAASGQYIVFLDADDRYVPQCLKKMTDTMEATKAEWGIAGYEEVRFKEKNGNKSVIRRTAVAGVKQFYENKDAVIRNINKIIKMTPLDDTPRIFDSLWNKIYRRNVIAQHQISFPDDMLMGEDYQFNLRYLDCCSSICIMEDIVYQYYINPVSVSTRFREHEYDMRIKSVYATELFYKKYKLNDSHLQFQYVAMAYSCFANLFLKDNHHSKKENIEIIRQILSADVLQNTLQHYRSTKGTERTAVWLLKQNNVALLWAVSYALYKIRGKR